MTPDHTKQANAALAAASNRTMAVCKEVQQTRIRELAKQAGGIPLHSIPSTVFDHVALAEFTRRVRESVLDEAAEVCVTHSHRLMYPSTGNAIALMCANDIKGMK